MHRKLKAHRHSLFFVKDRIDKKEIRIEYCPTELMLADFFTKPLQRSLFRKFRNVIMGYKPIDTLKVPHPNKEYVGNKKMSKITKVHSNK